MIEGIDISRWQTTTPDLTGRAFVFARATYGTSPDGRYAMHAANVRAAGRVLGAYAFGRNLSAADQVAAFLATAPDADLYALDLEKDGDHPRMTSAQARDFIAAVQATGRRIGLYMSESAFVDLGQDWDWVANWSREPARHWDFWQYRGSPLDLDRFDGTLADLRALGQETTMTYPVPKVPSLGDVAKGVRLYVDMALVPNSDPVSGDVIIDPGRTMPYLGQPTPAAKVVEYVNASGAHSGKAYFVKTAEVTNIRAVPVPVIPPDVTPFDQADIDAATAPLHQQVATLTSDTILLRQGRDAAIAAREEAIAERDAASIDLGRAQATLAAAQDEMAALALDLDGIDAFRGRH
jgi:hypothetical protein